jgi:hypothetical protein
MNEQFSARPNAMLSRADIADGFALPEQHTSLMRQQGHGGKRAEAR